MKRFFITTPAALILLFIPFDSSKAEIDIGYARQSGWSDNFFLENPDGWTLYLSKSLSKKMSMRFSLSRLEKNFTYIGVLAFGLIPPDIVLTREKIRSDLSVLLYEVSLHHALVDGNKMRLDIGGSIGAAEYDLKQKGQSTGNGRGADNNALLISYGVDVFIKEFIFSPLALRIGYQHRKIGTRTFVSDGFEPFSEVSYSSIRVDLLARFKVGRN